jgi:hypothetical protein
LAPRSRYEGQAPRGSGVAPSGRFSRARVSVLASASISRPARLSQDRCLRRKAKFSAAASRDSAYPAQGSTHSRRVQGAHLALAAKRGNRATRGGASAAPNCVRGIALPGWPRAGAANRSSPLIGRYPARIVARSILASGRHDEGFSTSDGICVSHGPLTFPVSRGARRSAPDLSL